MLAICVLPNYYILSLSRGASLFDPQDEIEIKKRLSALTHDVKLVLFVQTFGCEGCPETERLLKDLAALSQVEAGDLQPQIDRE